MHNNWTLTCDMILTPERIEDVHFIELFTYRERGRLVLSGVKSAIAGVNFANFIGKKIRKLFLIIC